MVRSASQARKTKNQERQILLVVFRVGLRTCESTNVCAYMHAEFAGEARLRICQLCQTYYYVHAYPRQTKNDTLMSGGELRSTGDGLVGREGKGWQESLTRGAASRRSSSKREHVATPLHTDTEIRFESHRDQAFTSLRHTCTLTHTCHTSFIWQCFSSLVAPSQPR